WPKRALSESDSRIFSRSISDDCYVGYYGTSSLESPGILLDCFEYDNGDDFSIDDLMKPKKCVTFSDKQATFVFRPGSSILGRRQKNQKKAKKKKEREIRKMISSLEQLDNDDDDDDNDGDNRRRQRLSLVNDLRKAIELQRYVGIAAKNNIGVDDDDDDLDSLCSSSSVASNSSGCDDTTSASDCSSADEMSTTAILGSNSQLNPYEDEINQNDDRQKSKRKNRRRRNRKNKLSMRTLLETGGYDSD
ncbi:hypothetical protein BLA29_008343, partial [Euroglyphus maynei]